MYPYMHGYSLFQEEISACAAVHVRYVMGAYDRVRSIVLFGSYDGDVVRACRTSKADGQ